MAQADQTVQNDTFPTVRADINNNLAALFSNNSGNVAPTTTVAHMDWIDTSGADPVWKKRNAANNGWITVGTIKTSALELANTLPSQTSNNGKFLTTDGTNASWATITASGQLLRAPQILTTGTSYTTPANCTKIYVEAVGGGGGSGRGGAGDTSGSGGAGGYCAKYFTVTPSTSYTYAIGAGGAGRTGSAGSGTAGGNTTFTVGATTITANGGGGGGSSSGGAGGSATNGDLNVTGGGGNAGGPNTDHYPMAGANSFFGGGGRDGGAGSSGGGGGSSYDGSNGLAGGAGLIRIWEYS
jgi:hypothetical protein